MQLRSVALVLALVLFIVVQVVVADALGFGRSPKRADPPWFGARAEIGVAYRALVWCPTPIELGGLWWTFPEPIGHWPDYEFPPFPVSIWEVPSDPYPVRGVLILSSPNHAVFRADSDGSEFTMTPHRQPVDGAGCL